MRKEKDDPIVLSLAPPHKYKEGEEVWFYMTEEERWPKQIVKKGKVIYFKDDQYLLDIGDGMEQAVHELRVFRRLENAAEAAIRFELEMRRILEEKGGETQTAQRKGAIVISDGDTNEFSGREEVLHSSEGDLHG